MMGIKNECFLTQMGSLIGTLLKLSAMAVMLLNHIAYLWLN
jgi:hypothetical protein